MVYEIEYEFKVETPYGVQDYWSGEYAGWITETKTCVYEIEEQELKDCLWAILDKEKDKPKDIDRFIKNNLDKLFEKYYKQIKDKFEYWARYYFDC